MNGVVSGGWGYVLAAYAVVWVGLIGYGASLIWRDRKPVEVPPEVPLPPADTTGEAT
jgi:hypothetical protein